MKLRRKDLAYLITGFGVVLAHYVIPYGLLRNAAGFTLYVFWSLLVLGWLIITLGYLRRW